MSRSSLRPAEIAFLLLLALSAFAVRYYGISSLGLCDAEVIKFESIQQYQQGHFAGVNSEHPMLMKVLAWGSLRLGLYWNDWVGHRPNLQASEETILRMPNLIFGAATAVVIYLFGKEMMGAVAGGAAGLFWAFLPLPITVNRILKEDTLLTFFTYLAFYFFWRAKTDADAEEAETDRFFKLSAVCFGLALASKYYLHDIGLFLLVWYLAGQAGLDHRPLLRTWKDGLGFWFIMGLTFVLANPVILSPTNDLSILHYVPGSTLLYHGHNVNGHVYMNTIWSTPFGMPVYFYPWMLAVKTPLPVLAAIVAGAVLVLFNRRSLAAIFLRVMLLYYFLPLCLVDPKTIRYLFDMLPFLFLLGGYAVEELYRWLALNPSAGIRRAGLALAGLVLFAWPTAETLARAPFYSFYVNQMGGGRKNFGKLFPPDEVDDWGVREAVQSFCKTAPAAAVLAVNNPVIVRHYLDRCGRSDLHLEALYDPRYLMRPGDLVLLQESRRYFETEDLSQLVERHGRLLEEVDLDGVVASRIEQFCPLPSTCAPLTATLTQEAVAGTAGFQPSQERGTEAPSFH